MKQLFVFFFIICSFQLFSQNLNRIGYTDGGASYELCLHENYLYTGNANTLNVYEIDKDTHIPGELTFSYRFNSNIDQLIVHAGHLYICANHDGLIKMNISNPENLTISARFMMPDLGEAAYDVSFFGNSILLAAKTKLLRLLDTENELQLMETIMEIPEPGRIRGLDIKENLLAFSVGYTPGSQQDGIYLYDIVANQQLNYYPMLVSDPLEVYFGQNEDIIHIMGGQVTLSIFDGYYGVLDYTDIDNIQLIYSDTIPGYLPLSSISTPMSAVVLDDTIYIATQGGVSENVGLEVTGQVYVYDATNRNDIHFVEDLYAGLYHFDIDINPQARIMYVASEWYGVLTVDIEDLSNETEIDRRLTGGWCHGSAVFGNRLAEANEGYGVRLFDISNPEQPILLGEDIETGFCRAISMDENYVYGWFLTGDGFRVYDNESLTPVSRINVDPLLKNDFLKSRIFEDYVAVILDVSLGQDRIIVADVSDPFNPSIIGSRIKSNVEDILFDQNGNLLVCSKDSILVLDAGSLATKTSITPPLGLLQPYKAMTLLGDTLYVFYKGIGEGIARYQYDVDLVELALTDASPFPLNTDNEGRVFLTSDENALYITSSLDPLMSLSLTPPHIEYDRFLHGGEFIFNNIWGVHDLFIAEDYLVLSEYMGQTSLFDRNNVVDKTDNDKIIHVDVYPNPSSGEIRIHSPSIRISSIFVYNEFGQLMKTQYHDDVKEVVNLSGLNDGFYFLQLRNKNGESQVTKIMIQR